MALTFLYSVIYLTVFQFSIALSDNNDSTRELLLSFVVHRHGDRTPDPDEIVLAENPEMIDRLSFPAGPTGLTNEGKRRGYQIGKFLRDRYGRDAGGLVSPLYVRDEVYLRSTDLERTKMTMLSSLAALYPPIGSQQWSEDLGTVWQPVPYVSVPSPVDYLRFTANCDRYKALLAKENTAAVNEFAAYKDLEPLLMKMTNHNFTASPLLYATLHDLFQSEAAIGMQIPDWAVPFLTRLYTAARQAYELFIKNDDLLTLATGVIIDSFLNATADIVAGEPVFERLRVFTAHDYNVGALMKVAGVSIDTIPDYGSLFALELYRSRPSGDYTVKPIFLRKAGEFEPIVPMMEGCKANYCDYNTFKSLVVKYAISETEYFDLCKT